MEESFAAAQRDKKEAGSECGLALPDAKQLPTSVTAFYDITPGSQWEGILKRRYYEPENYEQNRRGRTSLFVHCASKLTVSVSDIFESVPVLFKPLPNMKWPLAHSERVKELEALLVDVRFVAHLQHIVAAIIYHKEVEPDSRCPAKHVYFSTGEKLDIAHSSEYKGHELSWEEVCNLSLTLV